MSTSYRYANTPRRKGGRGLRLTLAGLVGVALWQNRDKVGPWVQSLRDKIGAAQGDAGRSVPAAAGAGSSIPADYDPNHPSVFNSTAMAGPRDGAGAATGLAGGSMGTDLGTQGEGARS